MSTIIWSTWGKEWALDEKVSFNGVSKIIAVNTGVTSLDINDVYSAWVRWSGRERWATYAMRYSGYDSIPGGRTGRTFFLTNGWKLVYDPTIVAISGVLYSDDYATAFWLANGNPAYPATVSALVNSSISYQNVVSGTALTTEETADAVWLAASRSLTSSLDPNASDIATQVRSELTTELTKVMAVPTASQNADATWQHSFTSKILTIAKFLGLK